MLKLDYMAHIWGLTLTTGFRPSVFELLDREEKHDGQLRGFHLSLTALLRLTPLHTGDRWCVSTVVVCLCVCYCSKYWCGCYVSSDRAVIITICQKKKVTAIVNLRSTERYFDPPLYNWLLVLCEVIVRILLMHRSVSWFWQALGWRDRQ